MISITHKVFISRLSPALTDDQRCILIDAHDAYERGHIPEGFAALGIEYTGQSAQALKATIDEAVNA